MILLKRGEISLVAVTATELGHTAPSYTFRFVHQFSKRIVNIDAEIVETRPGRIDFFQIDVDAHFENENDGEYSYEIFANYPFEQPSVLVEVGIMKLEGEHRQQVQYEGGYKQYVTYGR